MSRVFAADAGGEFRSSGGTAISALEILWFMIEDTTEIPLTVEGHHGKLNNSKSLKS